MASIRLTYGPLIEGWRRKATIEVATDLDTFEVCRYFLVAKAMSRVRRSVGIGLLARQYAG